MATRILRKLRSMKNSFEVLQDNMDDSQSEDSASVTVVPDTQSSSLSSLLPSNPSPASPSIPTQPPLFSTPIQSSNDISCPILDISQNNLPQSSPSPSLPPTPILFSTPRPNEPLTQEFLERLLLLRHVEVADEAVSPAFHCLTAGD